MSLDSDTPLGEVPITHIPLAQGIVASDPNDQELIDVVIPAFDSQQKFNDLPYMPRGDQAPGIGARCLVAFDDQGAGWVIAWT